MMPDNDLQCVTLWVEELKQGDTSAAERIWDVYQQQLANVARRRLGGMPMRMADEEDVALEAFATFLRGIGKDRFFEFRDRRDLWQALVRLVDCSAKDCRRRYGARKRGSGRVRGESIFDGATIGSTPVGLAGFADNDASPESSESTLASVEERLGKLSDDTLRQIAIMKLEGFTTDEIADRLQISRRSVERKLGLIRDTWTS